MFKSMAEADPSKATLRYSNPMALATNIRLGWKYSSLLRNFINYGRKKLGLGVNTVKLIASVIYGFS